MSDARADLRAYYEAEAGLRSRGELSERRQALVDAFAAMLRAEGRASVVDFGCGPGRDGERLVAAGCTFVGVDLAHGNAALAHERGLVGVQASVDAPPLRPGSIDAGWSMSTLMHLPGADVANAVAAMAAVLRPGAPLMIGLWGGDGVDLVGELGIPGRRRLFSLRTFARNRELLATAGTIEWSEEWEPQPGEWPYHVFRLRTAGGTGPVRT